MDSYNLELLSSQSDDEELSNYSSCLVGGTVSKFMTASSPIPFSEISAEFSEPHFIPEIEAASVSLSLNKNQSKPKPPNNGKFKCETCQKRFKTKGGLNLHLREHQPNLFLIRCPDCPFFTYQKSNFVKHAAIKHRKGVNGEEITENIHCPHYISCQFKCFTDEQLKLHLARKHTTDSEKQFRCTDCQYSTVEKAALEKHVAIVHNNEREYDCEICGFRSQTASGLARHLRSHLEARPHQCSLCPMRYADKKRLNDHLLKHSNVKQFSCSECKYATNRKDNLKTHIKRCHTDTP